MGASLKSAPRIARQLRRWACVLICPCLTLVFSTLSGCSDSAEPAVGPIQFVTASGQQAPAVTSIPVNGTIYLLATVSNDNQQLGVSWSVDCGSLPPGGGSNGIISTVCGVCSPAQTSSGPIPTYPTTETIVTSYTAPSAIPKGNSVTITAHATSLPSVTSNLTLTVVPAGQASSPVMVPPRDAFASSASQVGS
jgi:hypothetical protein